MSEQGKFLEELEAVKSIAASQDNKLTKDEVKKYLSDLELSQSYGCSIFSECMTTGTMI